MTKWKKPSLNLVHINFIDVHGIILLETSCEISYLHGDHKGEYAHYKRAEEYH